jgi:hypothetical protein
MNSLDFDSDQAEKVITFSCSLLQLLANQWNRSWGDVSSSFLQSKLLN